MKNQTGISKAGDWVQRFSCRLEVFFWISFAFLLISVLLCILFLLFFSGCKIQILWLDAGAIKSLATSVSLTGFVMAWLLQVVKDRECGQPMPDILKYIFHFYKWNIVLFLISSAIAIFFAGTSETNENPLIPKDVDVHVAFFALVSTILSIVNIGLLCSAFLFSYEKRREVAFSRLKDLAKIDGPSNKNLLLKRQSALEKWILELPTCIENGETKYISDFFVALFGEEQNEFSTENRSIHILFHQYMRGITRRIKPFCDPYYGEQIRSSIIEANLDDIKKKEKLLQLYIIAIGDSLISNPDDPHSIRKEYTSVWDYLWGPRVPDSDDDLWFSKSFVYYYSYITLMYAATFPNSIKTRGNSEYKLRVYKSPGKEFQGFAEATSTIREKAENFYFSQNSTAERTEWNNWIDDMLNTCLITQSIDPNIADVAKKKCKYLFTI